MTVRARLRAVAYRAFYRLPGCRAPPAGPARHAEVHRRRGHPGPRRRGDRSRAGCCCCASRPGTGWSLPAGLLHRGETPIDGCRPRARRGDRHRGSTATTWSRPRRTRSSTPRRWVDMVFEARVPPDTRRDRRRRRGARGRVAPARRPAAADRADRADCSAVLRHRALRRLPRGTPRDAVDALCAVVLAAGEGRRLRPLTARLPKALCPVGNVPLLDRALARLAALGFGGPARVAVNACYLARPGRRARRRPGAPVASSRASRSAPPAGSATCATGSTGGRVLVGNADAYLARRRPVGRAARRLGRRRPYGCWVVPARSAPGRVRRRTASPGFSSAALAAGRRACRSSRSDLVRTVWRPAEAAGGCEVVAYRRHLPRHRHARRLPGGQPARGGRRRDLVDPTRR